MTELLENSENVSESTFYWMKDAEADYGIYQSVQHEGENRKRPLYIGSRSSQASVQELCDGLNRGEITVDELRREREQRLRWRDLAKNGDLPQAMLF